MRGIGMPGGFQQKRAKQSNQASYAGSHTSSMEEGLHAICPAEPQIDQMHGSLGRASQCRLHHHHAIVLRQCTCVVASLACSHMHARMGG